MATLHHTSDSICPLCQKKLEGAHEYLVEWFWRVRARYQNVHVSCAWRGLDEQERAFREGKSRLRFPRSPHNHTQGGKPYSLALDLFLIDEDGLARFPPLFYAKLNQENEDAGEPIQWGGKWKKLGDGPHFQIDGSLVV